MTTSISNHVFSDESQPDRKSTEKMAKEQKVSSNSRAVYIVSNSKV